MSSILVFLLTTFLASLPIIEVRGAMPIGMSSALWGEGALNSTFSMLACFLGGAIACFVVMAIFCFLKKHLRHFKFFDKIFTKFEVGAVDNLAKFGQKFSRFKKNKKAKQGNITLEKAGLVFLFCLLPLPFTGVWSAGALASFIGLKFLPSVGALLLANLCSTVAVFFLCSIFSGIIDLILLVFVIIFILFLVYQGCVFLSNLSLKKRKSKNLE